MFPSFIGILDIQSWWEVPSIAYFCSLFRTAFNLLDFDIEELEEALLTDGTEESASSLLTELIVRLLNGCLGNNDVSAFNYQMYLRRLFRRKCQDTGRYNPFNTDIDFQFLPLRTKVEILYALCDFRLDADDVFDLFKNLEAESLRVEPLGWDDHNSAYWYFYGTRLYREDVIRKTKGKAKKKKLKEGSKKRGWIHGDEWDNEKVDRVWQVVCFTEEDWSHLTEKFRKATSKEEKELYRSLSQNFLPEIPRLFQEKERLQRKRLLEHAPRRTSSRVLQKIKQKVEDGKPSESDSAKDNEESRDKPAASREDRAKRRDLLRTKSVSSESSENLSDKEEMPQKAVKKPKGQDKRSKNSAATNKGEPPPEQPVKAGRKTNNSLASATGQILIPDSVEPANSTRKKLKTSQIFSQTEEDVQTDMYKVLEQLTAHEDAWPFMDPVEEQYAPNYYAVIRRPMDLKKMEERLDTGYYSDFSMFKADFKLIVNNCRLYNGQDNEYTMMVDNLQAAFDRLTEKYIHRLSSSDEEIAVEYQIPTPSRKHKLKTSESPTNHKRKKRKSNSDAGTAPSDKSTTQQDEDDKEPEVSTSKDKKESHHKSKEDKNKKKRKGHHRHGKHSKNHKKGHKSQHSSKSSKHSKKQKHVKDKDGKKGKNKKKRSKQAEGAAPSSPAAASPESSHRSRSASPLPSIHTPTPTPSPPPSPAPSSPPSLPPSLPPSPLNDPDFFKDKYDKIKERRRNAARDAWETLLDYKQKTIDKQKQNINVPEKDKNQKLRETIEKLKAKNEKYKDSAIFKSLFSAAKEKASEAKNKGRNYKEVDESDSSDEDTADSQKASKAKSKPATKKKPKKVASAKNESASEALEQAVKDISKWLDEAPKASYASSSCDSPAQAASPEDDDSPAPDAADKTHLSRKDLPRKRPSSRETKNVKRRDLLGKRNISIDRLQPGKSKGNLLTNTSKSIEKVEELSPGPLSKVRECTKSDESSPKLSLGSVLPTVEFTLGKDHNFDNDDVVKEESKPVDEIPLALENAEEEKKEAPVDEKPEEPAVECKKEEVVIEPEPPVSVKPNQEKATPNLSAWFKAFGTPKSTTSAPTTSGKKKAEVAEHDEKPTDTANADVKPTSPKMSKYDSPNDPETPNPDGGDSPLGHPAPRRRTSTGSSVSERSSFSQDLDSPRHQMSHTSPLLRSPASPRTDDFQKISYPIINGTVRAGFYQDTTSMKSSPEKSCSPREGPQSPYSPYSQHVYASNNMMGSTTPNYFLDHSKSPLPTYAQNQPPSYYDSHKSTAQARPTRANEEYAPAAADPYQHSQFGRSFSPAPTTYTHNPPVTYSQPTKSPLTTVAEPAEPPKIAPVVPDTKNTLFPVKKRTYSEIDSTANSAKTQVDPKENITSVPTTSDYQKIVQSMQSITAIPSAAVDDIAAALSEKTRHIRDRISDYTERHTSDVREPPVYENPGNLKKEALSMNKISGVTLNESIDMVNMGYMNPDDRRHSGDGVGELDYSQNRDTTKTVMNPQPKGYEIDAIALNLGMNSQHMQKAAMKTSLGSTIIPPAHCHERAHPDVSMNQMVAHSHHPEYSNTGPSSSIGNFSLNDIELANKKLYAGGAGSAAAAAAAAAASGSALDYGNWKMSSQMRKPEMTHADYAAAYAAGAAADKLKDLAASTPSAINYNKNVQTQQYHNYNVPRTSRAQDLPSELRIPNPRNLIKSDHNMSSAACLGNNDMMTKTNETSAKAQKPDKHAQNHPLVSSLPYKVPYSSHSALPLDSLRNLQNIPQMLERYTNDERYLSTFAASSALNYHDKTFQMAQMFNKSLSSDVHPTSTSASIYSQPSATMSKESSIYKTTTPALAVDSKPNKNKRKRSETKTQAANNQSYHGQSSATSDVLKTSMVPGSAFNFGATPNISLGTGGLYPDSGGFSIEDFRNSTANQLMAANYMAAAVAHQRNNAEATAEKMAKPAHQNSGHGSGSFPFMGHGQARGSYGFVGAEPSSPLYQQYLQRHQEELLRQTGAQIMGLYPPPYPTLSARQPYDTINRPSWL